MKTENTPKTLNAKMACIKNELSQIKIPKSGYNKFAGFKYHELGDFLGAINQLNYKYGVNDICNIDEVNKLCSITLINVDDKEDREVINIPYREAEMLAKGGEKSNVDAIQRMGSTITYNRRYLYITAYNIQENDSVDALKQHPKEKAPKPLTEDDINNLIIQLESIETREALTKLYNQDVRYKTNEEVMILFKEKSEDLKANE